MATTSCPDDGALLPAALGQPVADALRPHLDGCPDCARRVARLRAEVRALREAPSTATSAGAAETETPGPPGEGHAPPPAPAAIGKYLVVGRLGGGAQGDVFRAVHPELGHDLVLKLARKPAGLAGLHNDRLAEEGRLLAGLDHPNLVRVHDLGLHDGRPFLALEFVRGCNLQQFLARGRVSPRRSAALVAPLARAAGYLHRRGVVHQDIKPANILIDDAGRPRLIDLGLARLRDAWAEDGQGPSGGTIAFMAPEQARGEVDRVGPHSDVFALGAVLYFLLTGRAPFAGRDEAEAWDRAQRADFDRAALRGPGVPRRLARVVLRAMAAEPSGRYASADELAGALESFLRRPYRVAAQAGLLLVAALVVIAGPFRPTHRPGPVAEAAAPRPPAPRLAGSEPRPLRVELFEVELSRRRPAQPLGQLGIDVFEARTEDDARVRGRFSGPAYCYLIALNPDGSVQLCHPAGPDGTGDECGAPAASPELNYPPNPNDGYGLTDGAGVQAFVLVASRRPLPPYAEWRRGLEGLPWGPARSPAVWRYDGEALTSDVPHGLDTQRGTIRPRADRPAPLEAACQALRAGPGVETIRALAFPVNPAPEPGGG
jgi:hypothetical protein